MLSWLVGVYDAQGLAFLKISFFGITLNVFWEPPWTRGPSALLCLCHAAGPTSVQWLGNGDPPQNSNIGPAL